MNTHPRELRTEFGKHSKLYDEARPSYPPLVIDEIITLSDIPENGRVLDIGCGPGRATLLFGERRYSVLGVDLSDEMLVRARQKSLHLLNIEYIVGEFEHISLPSEPFDLVIAAQALHWVDPDVGYRRICDALTDSGMLAAFWNFENYEREGLAVRVRELYAGHCPAFPLDLGSPQRYIDKLDVSGLFETPQVSTHYWDWELTRDTYVNLARSWAWVSSLPKEDSQSFLRDLSKVLEREPEKFTIPFKTVLLTTTKKCT